MCEQAFQLSFKGNFEMMIIFLNSLQTSFFTMFDAHTSMSKQKWISLKPRGGKGREKKMVTILLHGKTMLLIRFDTNQDLGTEWCVLGEQRSVNVI